jgi:hypothetical protein
MIGTGAGALRSIGWASEPFRAQLVGERAHHVERHVRFEQRATHLAQRRIDVGFRQRAAPRQAIEDAAKLFRQAVEHRCPCFATSC